MKSSNSILVFTALILMLMSACKKSNDQEQESASFPLNTEWTGTMHLTGWRYDQPCCLRIRKDKTIRIYSLFAFIIDNTIENKDSLTATITDIENTGGELHIGVDFPDLPNVDSHGTLTIKNETDLDYLSSTGNFALHLSRFPDNPVSIAGGWTGPVMHGGPLEGLHAYPDLSNIIFGADGTTTYMRNGELAMTEVPQAGGQFTVLTAPYKQDGSMVWMDGYNETNEKLILYFGVLDPSGDKMMVDSRNSAEGRLPSRLATIDWNGPKGVTPVIYRE